MKVPACGDGARGAGELMEDRSLLYLFSRHPREAWEYDPWKKTFYTTTIPLQTTYGIAPQMQNFQVQKVKSPPREFVSTIWIWSLAKPKGTSQRRVGAKTWHDFDRLTHYSFVPDHLVCDGTVAVSNVIRVLQSSV